MSISGVYDKISFSSTYDLSAAGVLTRASGSDSFLTQGVLPGDSAVVGSTEYIVEAINSATSLQVTTTLGTTPTSGITTQTGAALYVQEAPKYIKNVIDAAVGGRQDIYGVSATEETAARNTYSKHPQHAGWVKTVPQYGYIAAVPVPYPGTGYGSTTALLSFSGTGGATGVALMSKGKVVGVSLTAGGQYTSGVAGATGLTPTATFSAPPAFTFNTKTAVGATSANITFAANTNLETGDALTFSIGATGMCGLTNGTTYYAYVTGATGIQVFNSAVNALASLGNTGATGLIPLIVDGGSGVVGSLTGLTAGATGMLTMGGRWGRILFETLVVTKNIAGDAENTMYPGA